ncbi:lipopolysaccharide heptosyltransferase family protein, partial [bacterium]|nr:lipopolysaccharide heptosyltransferase family protein [bacterium]
DFLGNAVLLVSNDTGIRNAAIATETPTVGIFFSAVVFRYWPRGGIHEVVFHHDFSVPSVDEVFDVAVKHIENVSCK